MKFVPFDKKRIDKELQALPAGDRSKLIAAMYAFEDGQQLGYTIKSYESGIKMITDSGRAQGRCLFFIETGHGYVMLKVYKKESQQVPVSVLKAAVERKRKYETGR